MNKTTILLIATLLSFLIAAFMVYNFVFKKSSQAPLVEQQISKPVQPSDTLKTYTDEAGFSFSYPDNLSLIKNEATDSATYSDLLLNAKGVEGNLALKITDTKFASLDDWLKKNNTGKSPVKDTKLGTLEAKELNINNKQTLVAIDKGVLFLLETPLEEGKDFWKKVYGKVLAEFSFAQPAQESSAANTNTGTVDNSSDAVIFEGEEVVE